jgi:hypothetical protein
LLFNLLLSCWFLAAWLPGGLADVVAGGGPAVFRAGRAARTWPSGFRCGREDGHGAVDGPKPAADPGGGEPAWPAGLLPGQPGIGGHSAGEPELGEGSFTDRFKIIRCSDVRFHVANMYATSPVVILCGWLDVSP